MENRRTFLKSTGLLAALGLAGCTDGLMDGGGGGDGTDRRSWQYDPATLASVDNTFFGDVAYDQLYANREYLSESGQSPLEFGSEFPLDGSQITRLTGVGAGQLSMESGSGAGFGSAAMLGSWDKATLTDRIESEGQATEAGTYEGFTLYERSGDELSDPGMDGSMMLGAGEDALVVGVAAADQTDLSVTGRDALTTMIDAANGDAPLLAENNEYVGTLESTIPADTMLMGADVDPSLVEMALQQAGSLKDQYVEGFRAGGAGATIDGAETTLTAALLYESATAAEETQLAELVTGLSTQVEGETEGIDTVDAEYQDNAVVVTLTGETQMLLENGMGGSLGGGQSQHVAPQVAFAFEYDSGAQTLTITHSSGDAVPKNQLYVRGSGLGGNAGQWSGSASHELDGEPAVVAGDQMTLSGVPPSYEAYVVWESDTGESTSTMAHDSGPEA